MNFRFHIHILFLALMFAVLSLFPGSITAQGPVVLYDPVHFGDPIHTAPDEELLVTLTIGNIGDEALEITSITAIDAGDGTDWINIGSYPATVEPGDSVEVAITLNYNSILSTGPDPAGYDAWLEIDHNAPSDPDSVYIHLTVASDFDMPQQAVLSTTWKQLMVYNTGQLGGGNDGYSLNIPDDCDTLESPPNALMYLNNASPVIAWNDGNENLAYTTLFDQEFTEEGTFRPQSDLHFYSDDDYTRVSCTVTTSDSLFAVGISLYAPTDGTNHFIIGKYEFFVWNPVKDANEVFVGLIADWDIPSDMGVNNGSGYDPARNTIWQYGGEYASDNHDACDGSEIMETDRLGGIRVMSSHLLNAWTEENEPYRLGSVFDKEYLYNRMSTLSGYNLYQGGSLANIHTGITIEKVDFTAKAKYEYAVGFVTTNEGEDDYLCHTGIAEEWAFIKSIFMLLGRCAPGDANADCQINVGDAVYLISYIFKGGPGPSALRCGDANGDCMVNVGDAVYIISYVFKGGPPPPSFEQWFYQCSGC